MTDEYIAMSKCAIGGKKSDCDDNGINPPSAFIINAYQTQQQKQQQRKIEVNVVDALPTNDEKVKNLPVADKHTAPMPTERHAIEYNMNHKYRGQALIFNHESFTMPGQPMRKGTDIDCERLRKTLAEHLDFEVHVHKDYTFNEINKRIEKVAAQDHSDNDCILIAILSHGDHGCIYANNTVYRLEDIVHYFMPSVCPTLAGKPKLFFVQACRGDRLDPGVRMMVRTETDGASTSMTSYTLPLHADFLFAYSTIPGFYSWRSPENGTWFIESLVNELQQNGKKTDLLTLLTFVIQRVAVNYESCVPDRMIMDQQKQIPCVTTMLTRILHFKDKTPLQHEEAK